MVRNVRWLHVMGESCQQAQAHAQVGDWRCCLVCGSRDVHSRLVCGARGWVRGTAVCPEAQACRRGIIGPSQRRKLFIPPSPCPHCPAQVRAAADGLVFVTPSAELALALDHPSPAPLPGCLQARAAADGLVFVAPYDDPYTIAGQGTIGNEILRQTDMDKLDAIFVAVGEGRPGAAAAWPHAGPRACRWPRALRPLACRPC